MAKKVVAKPHSSITWAATPAAHDSPAAAAYLGLLAEAEVVERCTSLLSEAPLVQHKAKDVLRAARLPLLPVDNPAVAKDLAKVAAGEELSPILLVQGDLASGRPLQIADGYHRACAAYLLDEDTVVACRLISAPGTSR
jgi:hypothetical protein